MDTNYINISIALTQETGISIALRVHNDTVDTAGEKLVMFW